MARRLNLPPKSPAVLASALLALSLTACGSGGTVDQAELEENVQTQLSESVGQQAPEASCPDELKAEEGAETRCTMDFGEEGTLGVSVTVTSVDGDNVKFDIQADEELEPPS